ncbi:MAG: hypothetical protein ACRD8W_10555 [Nitrososphaeraceae archaeon]
MDGAYGVIIGGVVIPLPVISDPVIFPSVAFPPPVILSPCANAGTTIDVSPAVVAKTAYVKVAAATKIPVNSILFLFFMKSIMQTKTTNYI